MGTRPRSAARHRGAVPRGTGGLGEHGGPHPVRSREPAGRSLGPRSTRSCRALTHCPLDRPRTRLAGSVGPGAPPRAAPPHPGGADGPARGRIPRRPAPGRGGRSGEGARPLPTRWHYLGLQPRRRPGQAGAGTAEVRGRHVLLVQPVVGGLPHSQVSIGGSQGEVGLPVRGEGAGDPRGGQGVAATAAARRHCCSGSAGATCSSVRRRTGGGRGLEQEVERGRGCRRRRGASGGAGPGRWPAGAGC